MGSADGTLDANNNNNNNNHDDVYSAVIMTTRSLREFTWFIKRPPTLRPSHLTWAVSPPVLGSYHLQPPSPSHALTLVAYNLTYLLRGEEEMRWYRVGDDTRRQ